MGWDFSDADAKDADMLGAMSDFSPFLSEAAPVVAKSIDTRFQEEGDGVSPWQELGARRVAERARLNPPLGPNPILHETGALRRRASSFAEHDADSMQVGLPSDDDPIAGTHENGGGNNIPARPFLRLVESEREEIDSLLVAYLESHNG